MNLIQKISISLSLFVVLVAGLQFSATANAALFSGAKDEACKGINLSNSNTNCADSSASDKLDNTIRVLINILSVIVGIAAVIMLIIGGLRFITSGGDANGISAAKRSVLYALIGLVLVALAQIIVKYVIAKTQ